MDKLVVTVAHDYQCPWSYLSLFQAQKLKRDFPQLEQNWCGYELLPGGRSDLGQRPQPSERFKALAQLDNLPLPSVWPAIINSHAALEGAEYVKEKSPEFFDQYNETIYRAFWERGEDISDGAVLKVIAEQLKLNVADFLQAISDKRYKDKIIPFKEAAYNDGITHITAFRFLGETCAEAPYQTIYEMAERYLAWYK